MTAGRFETESANPGRQPNTMRDVETIEDACQILIDWPHARRGPFYQAAREVVESALKGDATASQAREAFAALAAHAGVLVVR